MDFYNPLGDPYPKECYLCGTALTGGIDTYGPHDLPCCVTCWCDNCFIQNDWYGLAPGACAFDPDGFDPAEHKVLPDGRIDLGDVIYTPDPEAPGMGVYSPALT